MNIYSQRLLIEWRTHGKIIIAVDFDSTIFPYHTLNNKEDMERTIDLVKKANEIGAYIVIFTASVESRFDFIREYCESIKVPIDSINKNPIELPYGNNGKVYANIFIDDRAGLTSALDILEETINEMKTNK